MLTRAYGLDAGRAGELLDVIVDERVHSRANILAARVVRETYGVDNVVARIYDPHRAEIYQRLGIPTVATVRWTADQVLRRMLPMGATYEYLDPSGTVRYKLIGGVTAAGLAELVAG